MKVKWRIDVPEIVIGALITVAIYAGYSAIALPTNLSTTSEIASCRGLEFEICQQWRMAEAADGMVSIGWLQLGLTFLSLIGLGFTIYFTYWAARGASEAAAAGQVSATAAVDALNLARVNSSREMRAYLSVSPAGVNPLRVRSAAVGHVTIKNEGRVIANDVHVVVRLALSLLKNRKDFPVSDQALEKGNIGSVHPSATVRRGSFDIVQKHELRSDIEQYIYVWGRVTYDNGLGAPCFTNFCFRYNSQSFVFPEDEVPSGPMEAARYHDTHNDAS